MDGPESLISNGVTVLIDLWVLFDQIPEVSSDRLKNCINIELQNSTTILEIIYFIYGIQRRTMTSHNFLSRGVVREINFLCPKVRESFDISFPEN